MIGRSSEKPGKLLIAIPSQKLNSHLKKGINGIETSNEHG